METEESQTKLEDMSQRLAVMQWDVDHDQMNPAKMHKYQKLKQECTKLEEELKIDEEELKSQ
jgi:hypothetical protein